MAFKLILVPVTGGDGDIVVLDAALALAQRFTAHIEVLHGQLDPRDAVPFLGEGASGALIQQIMEAAQRDSATRATRAPRGVRNLARSAPACRSARRAAPVPARPCRGARMSAPRTSCVARRGRLADLIIVPQPTAGGSIVPTVSFEAALLDTGRPVLAVPAASSLTGFDAGPVLLAWNGSIESARAISAAIPLLEKAPRIAVLSVLEDEKAADGGKVVEYLAWHGVRADLLPAARKQTNVGAQILSEAGAISAGLLVMGAYTRSRLRRMVFGGVTEHVLTNAKIPAFMVH